MYMASINVDKTCNPRLKLQSHVTTKSRIKLILSVSKPQIYEKWKFSKNFFRTAIVISSLSHYRGSSECSL